MDVKAALTELRNGKKRKFSQSVELIVNLKNFDVRKEALNTFVKIPNPTQKKVAAFLTKRSKVIDTIIEDDFSKYNSPKQMKTLAKKYDSFMAVAPMMPKIATKFGRVFGPLNKMPSPQAGIITAETEEAISDMMNKMGSVQRIRNKEMAIKLAVGKEDMDDEKLIENIQAIVNELKSKLPRGSDNVKNVLIKFTMTPPVKIE